MRLQPAGRATGGRLTATASGISHAIIPLRRRRRKSKADSHRTLSRPKPKWTWRRAGNPARAQAQETVARTTLNSLVGRKLDSPVTIAGEFSESRPCRMKLRCEPCNGAESEFEKPDGGSGAQRVKPRADAQSRPAGFHGRAVGGISRRRTDLRAGHFAAAAVLGQKERRNHHRDRRATARTGRTRHVAPRYYP